MTRHNGQFMNIFLLNRQRNGFLHDTTSHSRIKFRVHIRLTIHQCFVEVNNLWFSAIYADRIFVTADIQIVQCRFHYHMDSNLCRCIVWQCEAIGQRSTVNRFCIRCQRYCTTCTAIVRIDAPLRTISSLTAIEVLCLHRDITIGGSKGVATRCR